MREETNKNKRKKTEVQKRGHIHALNNHSLKRKSVNKRIGMSTHKTVNKDGGN